MATNLTLDRFPDSCPICGSTDVYGDEPDEGPIEVGCRACEAAAAAASRLPEARLPEARQTAYWHRAFHWGGEFPERCTICAEQVLPRDAAPAEDFQKNLQAYRDVCAIFGDFRCADARADVLFERGLLTIDEVATIKKFNSRYGHSTSAAAAASR